MNHQNINAPDINEDAELAAAAFQEAMWLEELGDEEIARQLLIPGAGGVMPELVRQLLRERRGARGILENDEARAEAVRQAVDAVAQAHVDEVEQHVVDGEAFDAGVAGDVFDDSGVKITMSLKCPLMLYLEADDDLEYLSPKSKYLKRGVTVYIGFDKTTKLGSVFAQYCNFINEEFSRNTKAGIDVDVLVNPSDFEFFHCALLDPSHTVEFSAMMKNDRIKVRRDGRKDRSTKFEIARLQRESDRKYFNDLRHLMQSSSPDFSRCCDVIFDCKGKVVDEMGFSQNVLATTVRANSTVLSKRCKWLAQKIADVKENIRRIAEITIPPDGEKNGSNKNRRMSHSSEGGPSDAHKPAQSDDEDDIVPSFPERDGLPQVEGAAKVEDDEFDEPSNMGRASKSSLSPKSVFVPLDHSPEAVKLLLEYCYTNRVHSLGYYAFMKASHDAYDSSNKFSGPVPPFRKQEWPQGGMPTVSLHLALAGIALAEEAHIARLSLMCEIAASQLVNQNNVIDVLSACQSQRLKTGNRLPLLRKAAMLDCIYPHGSNGIDRLMEKPRFKASLEEKSTLVVPSLLEGTVELIPATLAIKDWQKKRDNMASDTTITFLREDNVDKINRESQRKSWRSMDSISRRIEAAFGLDNLAAPSPPLNVSFRKDILPCKLHRGQKRKPPSGMKARRGRRRYDSIS